MAMLRPQILLALFIFAAVGVAQSGYKQQLSWDYLGVIIIISSWWVNATSINDLADYEIDKINLKGVAERPLVNKQASRSQVTKLAVISGGLALLTGFLLNYKIGLLVAACLVLNYIYSMPPLKISHRGVLAPLLLPLGYVVLPFLVGAWAIGGLISDDGWVILTAIYISFIGRIILKDFRDVKGDAKFGKRTFLLRYGRKTTCLTSAVCLVIGTIILLTVLPVNLVIYLVFGCLLGAGLFGLNRLHKTRGREVEVGTIKAIVRVASGAVIILLAILILQNNLKPMSEQMIISAVLGGYFLILFWDTLNKATKLESKI